MARGETCVMPDNYEMSDISRILNILLREWDRSVEKHAAAGVDSSVLSQDMLIGRRLGWSEATVQTTRTVSFLTGASVVQMARSVSALFESTEKYGLTFGHVPLARSIYEGAGQVKWILADDDDVYANAVLTLDVAESERRCRRRASRGVLTTAANWQQCLADARFQKDDAMEGDALQRLEELQTRAGNEVAKITKSKDDKWWMLGITRPGARKFGEMGWQQAWWPEQVDWHVYGYVCAVSHHNLYPLAATLAHTTSNGQDVLKVGPPQLEVFAGGLFVTYTVYRMIALLFSYLEWPIDGMSEAFTLMTMANTMIQDSSELRD